MTLAELFSEIAGAIREKDSAAGSIVANTFPERIRAIGAGDGAALTDLVITAPPRRTLYHRGESFDPDGMTVQAVIAGDAVGISHDSLTFTPSGPLSADDTSVTVSLRVGGVTRSAEQAITVGNFAWWSPHMTSAASPAPYAVTAGFYQERPDNGGGEPWQMWDGNTETGWLAQADRALLWNAIDLGAVRRIKGIALFPTQRYNYPPAWFDLEASGDGTDWTFIRRVSGFTGKAEYQRVEFEAPFYARHVKISNVHESPDIGGFAGINEIELLIEV